MKPEPTTASHPAAILAIILVSYFMILLDNSVIFTALPSLQADLQLSTGELSWVQDAYTLASRRCATFPAVTAATPCWSA